MCLMKSPKNFEKIGILKIWQLVSLWGVKIDFGEKCLTCHWNIDSWEQKLSFKYWLYVMVPKMFFLIFRNFNPLTSSLLFRLAVAILWWGTYSQVPIIRTGPIICTVWIFFDWINYKYWTISKKNPSYCFFTTILLFLLYVLVGKFPSIYKYTYWLI